MRLLLKRPGKQTRFGEMGEQVPRAWMRGEAKQRRAANHMETGLLQQRVKPRRMFVELAEGLQPPPLIAIGFGADGNGRPRDGPWAERGAHLALPRPRRESEKTHPHPASP